MEIYTRMQTHLAPGRLFSLHLFQFVNLVLQAREREQRHLA